MTLDLTAARLQAESWMVDTCTILRDPQGPRDDVLNRTTLQLEPQTGDVTTVYSGPCLVSERRRERRDTEGDRPVRRREWQVRIPLSAPLTYAGDVILITASRRPELVGERLHVFDVNANTYATTRRHLCEDEQGYALR